MDFMDDMTETILDEAEANRDFMMGKLSEFEERVEKRECRVSNLEKVAPKSADLVSRLTQLGKVKSRIDHLMSIESRIGNLETLRSKIDELQSMKSKVAKLEAEISSITSDKSGEASMYSIPGVYERKGTETVAGEPMQSSVIGMSPVPTETSFWQYMVQQSAYPLHQEQLLSSPVGILPIATLQNTQATEGLQSCATSQVNAVYTNSCDLQLTRQRLLKTQPKYHNDLSECIPSELEDITDVCWKEKLSKFYPDTLPPGEFLTKVQYAFVEFFSSQMKD